MKKIIKTNHPNLNKILFIALIFFGCLSLSNTFAISNLDFINNQTIENLEKISSSEEEKISDGNRPQKKLQQFILTLGQNLKGELGLLTFGQQKTFELTYEKNNYENKVQNNHHSTLNPPINTLPEITNFNLPQIIKIIRQDCYQMTEQNQKNLQQQLEQVIHLWHEFPRLANQQFDLKFIQLELRLNIKGEIINNFRTGPSLRYRVNFPLGEFSHQHQQQTKPEEMKKNKSYEKIFWLMEDLSQMITKSENQHLAKKIPFYLNSFRIGFHKNRPLNLSVISLSKSLSLSLIFMRKNNSSFSDHAQNKSFLINQDSNQNISYQESIKQQYHFEDHNDQKLTSRKMEKFSPNNLPGRLLTRFQFRRNLNKMFRLHYKILKKFSHFDQNKKWQLTNFNSQIMINKRSRLNFADFSGKPIIEMTYLRKKLENETQKIIFPKMIKDFLWINELGVSILDFRFYLHTRQITY